MAVPIAENSPTVLECSLHGLLESDAHLVEFVRHVKELCEPPSSVKYRMLRYECVYLSSSATPQKLRVQCVLDPSDLSLESPDLEWYLQTVGAQRWERDYPCLVRDITSCRIDQNFDSLLRFLGYRMDFEFVEKGYRFLHPSGVEITISKPMKVEVPGDLMSLRDLVATHWLVEMKALCDVGKLDQVPRNLRNFADLFKRWVTMSRVESSKSIVASQQRRD